MFVIVQMFRNVILILLFSSVLSRYILFDEAKHKCSSLNEILLSNVQMNLSKSYSFEETSFDQLWPFSPPLLT